MSKRVGLAKTLRVKIYIIPRQRKVKGGHELFSDSFQHLPGHVKCEEFLKMVSHEFAKRLCIQVSLPGISPCSREAEVGA